MAMLNELKFDGGVPSGKLKVPPKSCMPNKAKIKMKRKSNKSNEMMDFIEDNNETTKFRNEDQYLKGDEEDSLVFFVLTS